MSNVVGNNDAEPPEIAVQSAQESTITLNDVTTPDSRGRTVEDTQASKETDHFG